MIRQTTIKTTPANREVLILPVGNGYIVKYADAKKFLYIFDKKREAVEYAKSLGGKLTIYDKAGKKV